MSFLDDAHAFMKNKPLEENQDAILNLTDPMVIEQTLKKLRHLYDNATEREIVHTLEEGKEKLGQTPKEKEFFLFARSKLED